MAKTKEFKRHPLAIAWDKWLVSSEGKGCASYDNLTGSIYLQNRLYAAFMAGAAASPDSAAALREALEKYGSHLQGCSKVGGAKSKCDCGYAAALSTTKEVANEDDT